MKIRYLALSAFADGHSKVMPEDLCYRFSFNVRFLCNYLSLAIRKLKIESPGDFKMIGVELSNEDSCRMLAENVLSVHIKVNPAEIELYLETKTVAERVEYYFNWLERGYAIAARSYDIPLDVLRGLNDQFRAIGYKNERLVKKMVYRPMNLRIEITGEFTMFEYRLRLKASDIKTGNTIADGTILRSGPDEIFFSKDIRKFHIEDSNIVILDFLDKKNFLVPLDKIRDGIVETIYCQETSARFFATNMPRRIEKVTW